MSIYDQNTINRIRLNMIIVNVGNKIMQDQLMDEIRNIGFSSIDSYLEGQRDAFYSSQKGQKKYFFDQQFNNMYPGGFDEKTKSFNKNANSTKLIEKFDYTLCKLILKYKYLFNK